MNRATLVRVTRLAGAHSLPVLLYIVLCATCSFGSAQSEPPVAEAQLELEGARAEVYKTIGDLDLWLHIFQPAGHTASEPRPAIVFFFGGGWRSGQPTQFAAHCRYLASRGMVAIAADYRVESRHGTTPFECVRDGKSAVRWILANSARLGVDPRRLAAGGGSAGGHVAAAAGMLPGLDEDSENLKFSAKPDALVLFNPVYDNGPTGYGYDRVGNRFREISPLHNIRREAPPTMVFLGTKDALVPVATAREFEERMKAVGSRCETHFYEGQPHGFFNRGRGDGKYYRETVFAMDRFLASLGWLVGPATIEVD